MSSSTTNLGLTKPVHGEMNWDATMNGNLDAIDAIFSGGGGKLDPTRLPGELADLVVPSSKAVVPGKVLVGYDATTGEFSTADDATGGGVTLPDQTGNAGKFLKTDGAVLSWDPAGGALPAWLANHPDAPPAVANAMDDEFSGAALDAKWTWVNQSHAAAAVADDLLTLSDPGDAAGDSVHYFYQAIPAGNWVFQVKLGMESTDNNYYSIGLILAESNSGKLMTFGFGNVGNHGIQVAKWNSVASWNGESIHQQMPLLVNGYFRIYYDGAGYRFRFSGDGHGFINALALGGDTAGGWFSVKPDRIGLALSNNQSAAIKLAMYAEHFRRIS